jgi:D-alanyl-D-alanine carboxypeptidase
MTTGHKTLRGAAALTLVAAAIGLAAVAGSADASEVTDPHQRALATAVDDWHDLGAVGVQGELSAGHHDALAAAGVADRRTGAPMPRNGHFRIGSNTKTFVSVVVLQLAGEGRLSLDDPVERWLPGVVSGHGNDGRKVTVRMLLQQTSGIADYTTDLAVLTTADEFAAHRFDHWSDARLVGLAMRHKPEFAPGTHWNYSNTNYVLAGMIVDKVTGQPWPAQVRDRILRPLGLRDTSYPGDRRTLARPAAREYRQFAKGDDLVDVTELNATVAGAEGGMVSTTGDLTRFWRALQGGRLLRPRQQAEMHRTVLAETYQDVIPGLRYGLGVFWAPDECGGFWLHPGDIAGVSTFNATSDDGKRSLVIYRTTVLADPAAEGAFNARVFQLADQVICR